MNRISKNLRKGKQFRESELTMFQSIKLRVITARSAQSLFYKEKKMRFSDLKEFCEPTGQISTQETIL
jgi:hypothetical protein